MAIRVIRICDQCKKEYEQNLDHLFGECVVTYRLKFYCSDCLLEYLREKRIALEIITKRRKHERINQRNEP